ncbi:membrane-anchored mycosin MYCP [Catenulispora sp. EB89]|uniref:S8 family serine peptidase n=1 Tax=Catenulispora sp. EB89 TaxID=3156257 RepID=UPI003511B938
MRIRSLIAASALAAVLLVPAGVASSAAHADDTCHPSDGQGVPNVPATVPWAQTALGLTDTGVWAQSRGQGVVVAVVDTGVSPAGPVLPAAAVQTGVNLLPGGGPGDIDCHGHGTMMAGVIAGRPGLATFEGVAPDATILPVTVTDESTNDPSAAARIGAGIRWAVDHGAQVVNVSITTTPDTPALDGAVAYASDHHVLIVAAAGNDQNAGPLYPASIPGVLSVGGIEADGSVYAQTEVGGHAGVAAPASAIWSVGVQPTSPNQPYILSGEGTSYASAFVAGTAALILAVHPGLTPDQLIQRIEATADRPNTGYLPDPRIGWGVVNPYRAVTAELPDKPTAAAPTTANANAMTLPVARSAHADPVKRGAVLAVIGAGVLALAVPGAAAAVRGGRRRGWKPGVK